MLSPRLLQPCPAGLPQPQLAVLGQIPSLVFYCGIKNLSKLDVSLSVWSQELSCSRPRCGARREPLDALYRIPSPQALLANTRAGKQLLRQEVLPARCPTGLVLRHVGVGENRGNATSKSFPRFAPSCPNSSSTGYFCLVGLLVCLRFLKLNNAVNFIFLFLVHISNIFEYYLLIFSGFPLAFSLSFSPVSFHPVCRVGCIFFPS